MNTLQKWLVVHGNVCDGFEFYGEFDTKEDAFEWADDHLEGETWIQELKEPKP